MLTDASPYASLHTLVTSQLEITERITTELNLLEDAPSFIPEAFLKAYQAIVIDKTHAVTAMNECHSEIAYQLGISTTAPGKFPFHYPVEANSLPDYDLDFANNHRVKEYAIQKYGSDRVCNISTYGKYKFKSLLKDLTRLFKNSEGERIIPLQEVNDLAKKLNLRIDAAVSTDLEEDGETEEKITFDNPHIQEFANKYPYVFEHFRTLYGTIKYSGLHAAGTLILPEPFANILPVRRVKGGLIASEWVEGQGVAELGSIGAIKIDLLGLVTLRILDTANQLIVKRHQLSSTSDSPCNCLAQGKECSTNYKLPFMTRKDIEGETITIIDLDNLCLNIEPCYETIRNGQTEGVFQIEPRGITEFARSYGPKEFFDLALITALYRPGAMDCRLDDDGMPIDGDLLPDAYNKAKGAHLHFIERLHGREKVTYTTPRLEAVLEKSMGITVFQEHLSQIIMAMTGCNFAAAEKIRKFFTKVKPELLRTDPGTIATVDKMRVGFIADSVANGCTEEEALDTWNMIVPYARYGFNKAHAVAYSIISYQTLFFRTFYPLEYFTALLTVNIGKEQKVVEYLRASQKQGFDVLKPDVNASEVKFSINSNNAIVAGLEMIKGMGEKAATAIVENRNKQGPFKSIEDFLSRDIAWRIVSLRVLEPMAVSGCFDSISPNRPLTLAKILIAKGKKKKADYQVAIDMFDDEEMMSKKKDQDIIVPDWSEAEKLTHEREVFGFPFDNALAKNIGQVRRYHEAFQRTCITNGKVGTFGIIEDIFVKPDKNGHDMGFITAVDLDGNKKRWVLFNTIYGQFKDIIHKNEPYFAFGTYSEKFGSYSLDGIQTLDAFVNLFNKS